MFNAYPSPAANVICSNSTGCSDGGLGVGLSRDSCCTNAIGGLSYINHVGCMTCKVEQKTLFLTN